jgi:enamine deaminase RidA (YjgF/YER057c/UK114 family)
MVEKKVKDTVGLEIPPFKAVGNYVGASQVGNLLFTSGSIPMKDGKPLALGKVGKEVTLEQAQECAKQCIINALGSAKSVIGDLDQILKIVKLTVYVNAAPGFVNSPGVANGASDFLVQIFGDNGKHARAAVGVAELPKCAC